MCSAANKWVGFLPYIKGCFTMNKAAQKRGPKQNLCKVSLSLPWLSSDLAWPAEHSHPLHFI